MSNLEGDLYILTTQDGLEFEFPDGVHFFIEQGNFAAPPVEFVTRRGYKQHGVTEVDYFLQPRTIEAHYHHNPADAGPGETSRDAYWTLRAELIDFLRHNRGGPLRFTVRFPDGRARALLVRADPGLVLPPAQLADNNWDIDERLQFVAFDPVWFDPDEAVYAAGSSASVDLVFPITFPIVFGPSGVFFSTGAVTYEGTWPSWPTMTLTGPYTRVSLTNTATGATIGLSVAIGAGETRTIDLRPGQQSIVDGSGNNKFGDLSPGSNLIDFNLRPDPEVPGGLQTIEAVYTDGTGASAFLLAFNVRYFGI